MVLGQCPELGAENAYENRCFGVLGAELSAKFGAGRFWRWVLSFSIDFGAGNSSILALNRGSWRWARNPLPVFGAGERLGYRAVSRGYRAGLQGLQGLQEFTGAS